jgi:hypothetical protein
MTITVQFLLDSGESLAGIPIELLDDGRPVASTTIGDKGQAVFDADPSPGNSLSVRIDQSIVNETPD